MHWDKRQGEHDNYHYNYLCTHNLASYPGAHALEPGNEAMYDHMRACVHVTICVNNYNGWCRYAAIRVCIVIYTKL